MNKKLIASISALLLTGNFSNVIPKFIHLDKVAAAQTKSIAKSKVTTSTKTKTTTKTVKKNAIKNKKYKDGVYTGTADGFRPGLTVSVTLKSDKITKVNVVSHRESRGFSDEPINLIPQEIVKTQSTDVDAVSGATYTSMGIMNAVKDALSKAKV